MKNEIWKSTLSCCEGLMQHLSLPQHLLFQLTGIFPMALHDLRLLKFFQQHCEGQDRGLIDDLERKCRFWTTFPAANIGCAVEMQTVGEGVHYEIVKGLASLSEITKHNYPTFLQNKFCVVLWGRNNAYILSHRFTERVVDYVLCGH